MGWGKAPVASSPDFLRIRALPLRGAYPDDLTGLMTRLLKSPEGSQTLLDVQAKALYDLGLSGGLFAPIRVGGGKTLCSFLAPRVLQSRSPLLILPAKLIEKTKRELLRYARDWNVAKHLRIMSYETLGRVSGSAYLDLNPPDLIIADEGHRLKNSKAAVTRRVARYLRAHPATIVVVMSGTIMKRSIKEFAHLLEWSHKARSVLPHYAHELTEWAEALDEDNNAFTKREPGVLLDLMPGRRPEGEDENAVARKVFFARCSATSGIVISDAKDEYQGSLSIVGTEYACSPATEDNFRILRETMCKPNGWALTEAMQAWAVARQIALGFHYEFFPEPPQEWLDARKAWAKLCREILAEPDYERAGIDSELQVRMAVARGDVPDPYGCWESWHRIEPTFDAKTRCVWHDHTAIGLAKTWLAEHPQGIAWVEHGAFGDRLAKESGGSYFRQLGLDAKGTFIEDADGPIIASVAANSEGRNLQGKWCDNLLTACPADAEKLEQVIGRTHRRGQKEDTVNVDVMIGCREHLEAIPRALASASVKKDLLGFELKISLADIDWPENILRSGSRWL